MRLCLFLLEQMWEQCPRPGAGWHTAGTGPAAADSRVVRVAHLPNGRLLSRSFWRCQRLFFSPRQAALPFLILLLAVALLGVERKCLSHAVILAEEPVFALFLISALSLDLSCFRKMNLS